MPCGGEVPPRAGVSPRQRPAVRALFPAMRAAGAQLCLLCGAGNASGLPAPLACTALF